MSAGIGPLYVQAEDAIELAELLEFLGDWPDHSPRALRHALFGFCGPGYSLRKLRTDLARFAPCSTAACSPSLIRIGVMEPNTVSRPQLKCSPRASANTYSNSRIRAHTSST